MSAPCGAAPDKSLKATTGPTLVGHKLSARTSSSYLHTRFPKYLIKIIKTINYLPKLIKLLIHSYINKIKRLNFTDEGMCYTSHYCALHLKV